MFLDDPDLFPIITKPNTEQPLQDGYLCKTNTFQLLKSVGLKRFEFLNNPFTRRKRASVNGKPLHCTGSLSLTQVKEVRLTLKTKLFIKD